MTRPSLPQEGYKTKDVRDQLVYSAMRCSHLPPSLPPSLLQFIHSLLILLCLSVLCIVKPYRKYHINVMEGLIIFSLFSATLSIYDRDNDLYVGSKTSAVFIAFPFLYGGGYIIYRILKITYGKMWYVHQSHAVWNLNLFSVLAVAGWSM